jgi:hypothetical protein
MARKPFFSGNYGSALARVDTRPIIEAGKAQGQMFANMGKQIGDTIQQYQLNKEKRDKAEAAFRGDMRRIMQDDPNQLASMQDDPVIGPTLKRIEEGKGTQKDFDAYNAFRAADKEALIEKMKFDTLRTQQGILEVQADLEKKLSNPKVKKAIAEANTAEDVSMYAKSIASADYAKKVADERLTAAQTEYEKLKTDLLKTQNTYKEGDIIEKEGVKFFYTGETFQPLNDSISKKTIQEAVIKGLDQAAVQTYLDDNYNYDEESQTYTFDKSGFFGGKRNPMMEEAITILGLRGQVKLNKDDTPTQEEVESAKPVKMNIKQLAQEALDDPKATEREKQKAREILGQ